LRTLSLVVLSLLFVACAPAPDHEVRRARLATETRNLEATFDALEDRLLVNQARVRFWQEMRERHESATAIACASLDRHADDIARTVRANEERHAARRAAADRAETRDVAFVRPSRSLPMGGASD
jgi:hypothetical protein